MKEEDLIKFLKLKAIIETSKNISWIKVKEKNELVCLALERNNDLELQLLNLKEEMGSIKRVCNDSYKVLAFLSSKLCISNRITHLLENLSCIVEGKKISYDKDTILPLKIPSILSIYVKEIISSLKSLCYNIHI